MKKIKKLFSRLGPGFITGASDDDPSGIATYAQTGAQFGYQQLWLAPFSYPFMSVVQEMCGRIGLVTGRGLAGVIKKHYPKPVLYAAVFFLVVANTFNIGADLGAMAQAGQLLFGIPFIVWLLGLTALTLILEVFISYKVYASILKYFAFSLLAYIITVFLVKQDWKIVFYSTIIPSFSFSKEYIMNIVAVLGTTISPYLFFWQTGEEVEEEVAHHKLRSMGAGIPRVTRTDIKTMRIDTFIGMFFSNVIMFFIIATTASTLGRNGIVEIGSAAQAAQALLPLAGDFAFVLFAAGIIGTGLLAIPILAGSASYAISEAFGWKEGLYQKPTKALGFYLVICLATLIGVLLNFTPIPPFKMLYYAAILNGLISPVLLLLILFIANNKEIMGVRTNNQASNLLGIFITVLMATGALLLLWILLFS